ncbi:MAG: hypothetical protein NTY19_26720 [Planctomycetota bacterium]|nr:hypothetical protein [Planctomycetota bacterium]
MGTRLKSEFERQLAERLPQFRAARDAVLRDAGRVFHWHVSGSCHVFILLLLSRRDNEFTIELAWTTDTEFPPDLPLMNPIDMPQFRLRRDMPKDGRFRFRLAGLFHPRGEFWWPASSRRQFTDWVHGGSGAPGPAAAPADDDALLVAAVAAAIEAIERHGMPYLSMSLNLAKEST